MPTPLSGRSLVNFPPKTEPELRQLVEANDEDVLYYSTKTTVRNRRKIMHNRLCKSKLLVGESSSYTVIGLLVSRMGHK